MPSEPVTLPAPSQSEPTASQLWERLTPRQRLARLLLVRSDMAPDGLPDAATAKAVAEGVGAFHGPPMLERAPQQGPAAARKFNLALAQLAVERFGIAPLIGGNAEAGLSYTTRVGGTDVPYPAALAAGDPALSHDVGALVGSEFAACGYSWAFQPVVDVRTTTLDPVIGVRSFGTDPELVSRHAAAYIHGMQSAGVLGCAKHYPGHGDATVDSHLGLPVVQRSPDDHQQVHLPPFRAAIDAGVATIMTAHVALPTLEINELATFSHAICTEILRDDLGFEGLLVTDSLRMRAVEMSAPDAFGASLRAGCDVMNVRCWPEDVPALLDVLETRYATAELPEADIRRAFERVLAAHRGVRPRPHDPLPSEQTMPLDDDRLRHSLSAEDDGGVLPIPIAAGGTLGVMVASPRGTDAPPLGLIDILQQLLGLQVVRLEGAGQAVDAVLVISYGQAGPTPQEHELFARAQAAGVPAAALLAGPPLDEAGGSGDLTLPWVAIPAIDVFGMPSLPALALALSQLVRV